MRFFRDQRDTARASARSVAAQFSRLVGIKSTIRTQIVLACLAFSTITVALGCYAALGIHRAGDLVTRTFDESLMSINYARAAAADFAGMRAAFARRLLTNDGALRNQLKLEMDLLAKTLAEDLSIAAERSQSSRAATAASKVQEAANAWLAQHSRLLETLDRSRASGSGGSSISDVDQYSKSVDQQIELLI